MKLLFFAFFALGLAFVGVFYSLPSRYVDGVPFVSSLVLNSLNGNTKIVQELVDKGFDVNEGNKYYSPLTACILSKANHRVAILNILLKNKANPNLADAKGRLPLVTAADNGKVEIVELLLTAGAELNTPDKNGVTPLMSAASKGRDEVIKLLVQKGAHINAQDHTGGTALMAAAGFGRVETLKLLLSLGADKNIKDKFGKTALDIASQVHEETIKEMLR